MTELIIPYEGITITPDRPAIRLDCRFRGDVIDLVDCESCAGSVRLKVFACSRFYQATTARVIEGAACCATCDDYEPTDDQADKEAERRTHDGS